MVIYELKVNKWEPMLFEHLTQALAEAEGYLSDRKNRVMLTRKNYQDGCLIGSDRIGVRKFQWIRKWLTKQCKSFGTKYIKVAHVRHTDSGIDDDFVDDAFCDATPDEIEYAAALAAEYKPHSDIVIDDYEYVPRFYDVYGTLRVYGYESPRDFCPAVLYETPRPEPKPHVMDY